MKTARQYKIALTISLPNTATYTRAFSIARDIDYVSHHQYINVNSTQTPQPLMPASKSPARAKPPIVVPILNYTMKG